MYAHSVNFNYRNNGIGAAPQYGRHPIHNPQQPFGHGGQSAGVVGIGAGQFKYNVGQTNGDKIYEVKLVPVCFEVPQPTGNITNFNKAAPQCRSDGQSQYPAFTASNNVSNGGHFRPIPNTAHDFLINAPRESYASALNLAKAPPQATSFDRPRGGSWESHHGIPTDSPTYRPAQAFDNKKKKTELCKHYEKHGVCPYGDKCHFAHGEEDRVSFENVEEMQKAGVIVDATNYMCRPCPIFVSTGACPYSTRCKFLHDPNIRGNEAANPSWLEHCTKCKKKEPDIIPDRLYHHRINGIHQENPIIDPFIWEGCRPTSRFLKEGHTRFVKDVVNDRNDANKLEWEDTYSLVCNNGVPIFNPIDYAGHKNKSTSNKKLSELQKLCIVLSMRRESPVFKSRGSPVTVQDFAADGLEEYSFSESHLDFTYAPTHCLNGQPCMILQNRYFRLLDPKPMIECRDQSAKISIKDIVQEVTYEEYNAWQSISPNAMVRVHEVAFDSKGKRSANLSVWFDVDITPCSNNKAKKLSKKGEDHWKIENNGGALFCMPKNETFELSLPVLEPYVSMQPVGDFEEGHDLVEAILEHRIGTILHSQGSRFEKFPFGKAELENCLDELEKNFVAMRSYVERWVWPKTSNMDHICKTAEERNQTKYSPETIPGQVTSIPAIWESFVKNLDASNNNYIPTPDNRRMRIFCSITSNRKNCTKNLPRIRGTKPQINKDDSPTLSETTWKELLLGTEGPWKLAIESHQAKNLNILI